MWSHGCGCWMHSKVKHIFICLKMEVNLISVICVQSFGMAIVKITCSIHNAFCFAASLPVNNFHCSLVKSTFQSVYGTTPVNQAGMLLTAECCIVLLIPNTILPRVQAHTTHGFQRSRNQAPSCNPFSPTHRDEVPTVTYFSFNHLWGQRALSPKLLERNTNTTYIAIFPFLKKSWLKRKKKSIYIL